MTDDETTHALILASAIAVVADVGYRSTSLTAVAAGAGVPESVVEHEFPSKAMLMSEAVAWIFGDVAHYMGSRIEAEPEGLPRIRMYIRALCTYYYDRPRYMRAMRAIVGSGELQGPTKYLSSAQRWRPAGDILAEGQRKGLLGQFDPRAVAIVIAGGIDGLFDEWSSDPSFDLPAAAGQLEALVAGLTRGAVFAP